jgi:hypothetical protein
MASKRSGLTLITALAFTVVVGTVLAGVGTVAVSHYGRSETEGDYANAIALADAGINYELLYVSRNINDPGTPPHQEGGAYTGTIPGVPGTFTVFVRDWNSGACDSGSFAPPEEEVCVVSTGTVNGISRTAIVRGIKKSLFDEYALFAYKEGVFGGGGAGSGTTSIVGNLGTNGPVTFNGTKGSEIVVGELTLNGGGSEVTDDNDIKSNVVGNPEPVELPTVSEIADSLFGANGLTWLQTNNDNASIRILNSADTGITGIPDRVSFLDTHVASKLASAGFTSSSRTFSDPPNSVPSATSTLDQNNGVRFATPLNPELSGTLTREGILGKKTYFLPPGDYYFNNIDFKSGNAAIVMLTHLCGQGIYANKKQIRIWIDETSPKQDYLQTVVVFTDIAANKFRVFYNKCNDMNIGGNSIFNGGFYSIRDGCSGDTPMMHFTGGTTIFGSVMTDYFNLGGSTQVIFPNNGGGSDPADFPLWYGFKDGWKEIPAFSGRPTFVDGSSK